MKKYYLSIRECKKHRWIIQVTTNSSNNNPSNFNKTITICANCGKEKSLIDILDLTNEPNIIPDIIDKLPKN